MKILTFILLLICSRTGPCQENNIDNDCFYLLELHDFKIDKKVLKYYKRDQSERILFLNYTYYFKENCLIKCMKGYDRKMEKAYYELYKHIVLDKWNKIENCINLRTLIKIDFKRNIVECVNDQSSYDKLFNEYLNYSANEKCDEYNAFSD